MTNSAQKTRIPPLERGINFRDLGGYRADQGRHVRWRQLFRSGSTHLMLATDRDALSALIRTAVDLRSHREREDFPHILSDARNVSYLAFEHDHVAGNILRMLSQPDVEADTLRALMIDLYRVLPYQFAATYRQLFLQAASGPLPLMFNCTAGKDRTGVAAALLLSALGVAWDDVMEDYLLTELFVPTITRLYENLPKRRHSVALTPEKLAPVFGVDRGYLEAMRQSVEERHGSIQNYVRDALRIDPETLAQLQSRLLGAEQ